MDKSYAKLMDEISDDELYEGLLAYGLFTDMLPPVFSSVDFYKYCQNLKEGFRESKKQRQYVYYEAMRNINAPRSLAIPNPIAYQKLCHCLSDNWGYIKEHLKSQTSDLNHKIISRIHIRKTKDSKTIFKMNYDGWRAGGSPVPDLLIGKKYVVKADISTCFPSIYTHSIPWALIGKENSKKNKKRDEWFNQIDHCTQNCKNGETHGLLIGPHASSLLSEIILTVVDHNLYERHHDDEGFAYIRNIDDYTCYVDSMEKAQSFLTELGEELRKFDLSLNFKKTEIQKLPIASEEEWVRKLKSISLLKRGDKLDYAGAKSYLDLAIDLMRQYNENSSILNYAIKALSGQQLTLSAKRYCIKTIFHLSLLYPYLIRLLDDNVFRPMLVDCDQIRSFSNKAFRFGLNNKNYEEVCFSIYFSLKYNFEINNINIDDVISSNSCLLKLFIYLYFDFHKNQEAQEKLKEHAKALAKNDSDDFDGNWLFVYEILSKSDLKNEWKSMKEYGVSFIDKAYIRIK